MALTEPGRQEGVSAVPLQVRSDPAALRRLNEPFTVGVPLPKGLAGDASGWILERADGVIVPIQVQVLDRWSDQSLRWVLVDSSITTTPGEGLEHLALRLGNPAAPPSSDQRLTVSGADGQFTVSTGTASFVVSRDDPGLFRNVPPADAPRVDAIRCDLRVMTGEGHPWAIRWLRIDIEEQGSLRVVVLADGEAHGPSDERLRLIVRLHFYAGQSVVRLMLTVRNPARAEHPGGIWELGDAGSVLLRELSINLKLPPENLAEQIRFSLEPGSLSICMRDLEIYQESSGGENWASANHVNRHGAVPVRFRGYRGVADGEQLEGERASPIVVLERDRPVLGVAVPYFWQNCPRAIRAQPNSLCISFFPSQYPDVHELQGGEQKTHECYLLFGSDRVTETPMLWCRSRVIVHPSAEWYAASGVVPYLGSADSGVDKRYQMLVNAAIEGSDSFETKRERVDEYGWRHFGDIYGDHEAVFARGTGPLVSHYNNQYDAIAGFAYQFMRTGDWRWWTQFQELAAHVVDIDIYHTQADKSAYNHGMFWHTIHYSDAGKSTHRTYPAGTIGGGPSSEHNYTSGLTLHYFVTGSRASREAAIGLAQFVIDIDDGRKTVFSWLDGGDTGQASASRTPTYHGPGRGSGNSLNALIDGHRMTGERRFLDKAEQIIRRCTHPRQELESLNLLDAEERWFYTMYLQALGKYLDYKVELGANDAMYGYARDVLLHYARWMTKREYPYLEKPEILEFPTETWAAQDMRKSEVFDLAARFAVSDERRQFLEKAEFFFSYSISTLEQMPTRTLTRPVVLLLSHGFSHSALERSGVTPAPMPREGWQQWPLPHVFVPQKVRAKRRALALASVGGTAVLLGLLWIASFRL
jgi:hypothetical protein